VVHLDAENKIFLLYFVVYMYILYKSSLFNGVLKCRPVTRVLGDTMVSSYYFR